ncbi:hypothetical protein ACFQFH_13295 [Halobaculum halobium]|uniref:hypothetical protein n=1 Tax=Halobaculum halobium TaxID=3032281 RepID=UPI00361262E9
MVRRNVASSARYVPASLPSTVQSERASTVGGVPASVNRSASRVAARPRLRIVAWNASTTASSAGWSGANRVSPSKVSGRWYQPSGAAERSSASTSSGANRSANDRATTPSKPPSAATARASATANRTRRDRAHPGRRSSIASLSR